MTVAGKLWQSGIRVSGVYSYYQLVQNYIVFECSTAYAVVNYLWFIVYLWKVETTYGTCASHIVVLFD